MHATLPIGPVDLLRHLVGISSVSSESNKPLIDFLESYFETLSWHTRLLSYDDPTGISKHNLIASPQPLLGSPIDVELAIVCHTDTVPPIPSWEFATSLTERTPGVFHGCGACDVKGFLASLLAATRSIEAAQLDRPLALIFTADEEVGCRGARFLQQTGALRARYAIVGEPTSLVPAHAGKGYCLARVTVHGRAAHSAYPSLGRSAILGAAHLINAIGAMGKELEAVRHDRFDPPFTTINIGEVQGGTAKNVVPATCTFLVEWRPIPDQPATLVTDRLQLLIDTFTISEPDISVVLDILRLDDGFECPLSSPLLGALLKRGHGASPITVAFGTEAPWFTKMGAETIVIGPGSMHTAHSDRECVASVELEEAATLLRDIIHDLCA